MNTNNNEMLLLTSTVIAALLTSIVNIIIAVFNNIKLKSIENSKFKKEIQIYRYTHLYDMLLKWKEYNTLFEMDGLNLEQIASNRLINSFIDNHAKFNIISPLIDDEYKTCIYDLYNQGYNNLNNLISIESEIDNSKTDELIDKKRILIKDFFDIACKYANEIENVIHIQLKQLLET